MKTPKILVADDQQLLLEAFGSIIKSEGGRMWEVTSYNTSHDRWRNLGSMASQNDVVVLFTQSLVRSGQEEWQSGLQLGKVLAISQELEKEALLNLTNHGIRAFVSLGADKDELIEGIGKVAMGEGYYCKTINSLLTNELMRGYSRESKPATRLPLHGVSLRELEVLRLISDGHTNEEIARKLHISHLTVKSHRKNLLEKLQSKNTAQLVKNAMQEGLLESATT